MLTLNLGATDQGVGSEPTPADATQFTESLQPLGKDSEFLCNLRRPLSSEPIFRGIGMEAEAPAGRCKPNRCTSQCKETQGDA